MSRTSLLLTLSLVLAAMAWPAGAIPATLAPHAEPTLLGELPMGALNAVAYAGGYTYAGLGPRVLTVGVTDPGQPRRSAFGPPLGGWVTDLDVAGGHLFVAAGDGGFHVYSLAEPAAPRHVGALPGRVTAVVAGGGYAYAAAVGDRLLVVDVRAPDRPEVVAEIAVAAGRLALHGGRLYATRGPEGVAIYDVSAPAAPRQIATYDSPGTALDVAVSADGGLAAVADKTALRLVDVTDAALPREVGAYTPARDQECYVYVSPEDCRTVERVRLSGQQAFVMLRRCDDAFSCRAAGGLRVVDLAQPAAPREVARQDARGNPSALAVGAGHVYLAQKATWWYGGIAPCMLAEGFLQILSGAAEPVGMLTPMASPASVYLTPGRAWLADPIADLGVLDLADPAAPRPVAPDRPVRYFGMGYGQAAATDVFVTADAAAVTIGPGHGAGASLAAGTIAPAARPQNGCAPPSPSEWFSRVVADATYAYVLDATGTLQILNLASGGRVGAWAPATGPGGMPAQADMGNRSLDLAGHTLYVAGVGGLAVLDVSDPTAPRPLGQMALAGVVQDVAALGPVAYVAAGDDGVYVVDVRDPAAPAQVGRLAAPGAVDVAAAGTRLYVAAGSGGLRVFDVTRPAQPVEVASVTALRGARRVAITDGLVGVLADGGLFLLAGERLPTPTPGTPTPLLLPYANKG